MTAKLDPYELPALIAPTKAPIVPFAPAIPAPAIGFGEISLDDPRALDLVDLVHEAGFRGLGEITSPLKNYDDRATGPSMRALRNMG